MNETSVYEMRDLIYSPVGYPWPRQEQRTFIGHVGIDTYSESSFVNEVLDHALHGSGTRQIVTVNAQIYVLADKSLKYRECLDSAEYLCSDGMPLVWACNHLAGVSVPRITGVDLIDDLCKRGAADGLSIFLLGGRPGTGMETARILSRRYPGLKIAGVGCPDWGFEMHEETVKPVLEQIAQAKPHILFVALGAPKQEFFIDKFIRPLNVPIAIGVGGSFEILSGLINRAPMWMQSSGFEWAYRLFKDPRRLWRRYLIGNAEFVWSVTKWKLQTFAPHHGMPW
jgi:N-acetylglucosaminyldiphosphoundecaprenol N-acetyl-beta-D-mannosaminyltransferase